MPFQVAAARLCWHRAEHPPSGSCVQVGIEPNTLQVGCRACAGARIVRTATGERRARAPSDCNSPCNRLGQRNRMVKPYSARKEGLESMRTGVRICSVRTPAYSTNTCSIHRTHQRLRSAFCGGCVWFARSCFSRTTTRSTGRSIRTSLPSYPRMASRPVERIRAMVSIYTGERRRVDWGAGVQEWSPLESRCVCVLWAGELAPECRAALSCPRNLAR
jgi:hypothetical protein